jgi:hypothetical protein
MSFRFRLDLKDGSDLDDYVTAIPGPWKLGDTLYVGGLPVYRITDVVPLNGAETDYSGIWTVVPLGQLAAV